MATTETTWKQRADILATDLSRLALDLSRAKDRIYALEEALAEASSALSDTNDIATSARREVQSVLFDPPQETSDV